MKDDGEYWGVPDRAGAKPEFGFCFLSLFKFEHLTNQENYEQEKYMLSGNRRSCKLAIQINIQIMRVFTRIRQMAADYTSLQLEIAEVKHAVVLLHNADSS